MDDWLSSSLQAGARAQLQLLSGRPSPQPVPLQLVPLHPLGTGTVVLQTVGRGMALLQPAGAVLPSSGLSTRPSTSVRVLGRENLLRRLLQGVPTIKRYERKGQKVQQYGRSLSTEEEKSLFWALYPRFHLRGRHHPVEQDGARVEVARSMCLERLQESVGVVSGNRTTS